MSDSERPLVPDQLLPPGVRDERQLAFVRALDSGLKRVPIQAFIMSDADTVDAQLLPVLVREYSVQEFMVPDMPESVVRKFVSNSHQLHAKKGYIEGVRLGLSFLSMVVDWKQWWQQEPAGEPNTHVVTAYVTGQVFENEPDLLSGKNLEAALRMIDAMKRWSQDIDLRLGVAASGAVAVSSAGTATAIHRSRADVPPMADSKSDVMAASAATTAAADRSAFDVPAMSRFENQTMIASAAAALMVDFATCEVR